MIDSFLHILDDAHREIHTSEVLYPRRKKHERYDDKNVFHAALLTESLTRYLIMLSYYMC